MVTRKQWRVLYRALIEHQINMAVRYEDSIKDSSAEMQALYLADLERAKEALDIVMSEVKVDWSSPVEEAA